MISAVSVNSQFKYLAPSLWGLLSDFTVDPHAHDFAVCVHLLNDLASDVGELDVETVTHLDYLLEGWDFIMVVKVCQVHSSHLIEFSSRHKLHLSQGVVIEARHEAVVLQLVTRNRLLNQGDSLLPVVSAAILLIVGNLYLNVQENFLIL